MPNLEVSFDPIPKVPEKNYLGYAKTIINSAGTILDYLDLCIHYMSKSNDPDVVRRFGFEIDLYACGKAGINKFRNKMIEETKKGLECLMEEQAEPDGEVLEIDK